MRRTSDWGKALRRLGKETGKAFITGKTTARLIRESRARKRKETAKREKEEVKALKRRMQLRALREKEMQHGLKPVPKFKRIYSTKKRFGLF